MATIWEAVLASSAVSAAVSAFFTMGSKHLSEIKQERGVAQTVARALEHYTRQCAITIEDMNEALNEAEITHDLTGLSGFSRADFQLPIATIENLKPLWRDRAEAFPGLITTKLNDTQTHWDFLDPFEFVHLRQDAHVELGKAAFALATEIRKAYKLPLAHAYDECRSALEFLDNTAAASTAREEREKAANAALADELFSIKPSDSLSGQTA